MILNYKKINKEFFMDSWISLDVISSTIWTSGSDIMLSTVVWKSMKQFCHLCLLKSESLGFFSMIRPHLTIEENGCCKSSSIWNLSKFGHGSHTKPKPGRFSNTATTPPKNRAKRKTRTFDTCYTIWLDFDDFLLI